MAPMRALWRQGTTLISCLSLAWLIAAGCNSDKGGGGPAPNPSPGTLVINELLAINNSIVADDSLDYDDWIELWNPGPGEATTGGLYLSDNLGTLDWPLPDTTLAAGAHLLVWTDNEPNEGRWHATFRLSGAGEQAVLYRSTPSGTTLVDSVSYGPQRPDTSYARQPDGGAWSLDPTPTPRAANN